MNLVSSIYHNKLFETIFPTHVYVLKKELKLKKYKIKPKETLRDICLKKNINTYFVYRTNKKILKNKKK